MSAYSDWRCGAITDEEYKFYSRHELGADHGEDDRDGEDDEDREVLPDES